jgi:predicted O-linked N-acetylglucosamine transferase (SPINDLY family)
MADDAVILFQSWLAKNPTHPLVYAVSFNFGVLLDRLDQRPQAAAAFRSAIDVNPTFLPPYINLGNLLEQAGDRVGAASQWQALIGRLADITQERINYKTMALKLLGRMFAAADLDESAEEALFDIISINPHQRDIMGYWLNLRQRQCKWRLVEPLPAALQSLALDKIAPLTLASYSDDPLWQLSIAVAFTSEEIGHPQQVTQSRRIAPANGAAPARLRIGYLSSDLCEHAVGYLTVELFSLHDRSKLEIFAYYNGTAQNDRIQQRIRTNVDHWRDIRALPDDAAARLIQDDGINILVDLNGHTKDARIALLARNPAPVIVNWLGFPGSMGSVFHHYIIADDFIIPPESEMFYSERVLRLPCYQPIDRKRLVAETPSGRGEAHLPDAAMVYCCFNEPRKITEQTWQSWMDIMSEVPNSVLWLLIPAASTQTRMRNMADAAGIDPARLVFASRKPNDEHLARYQLADLILDCFPYGAHTTASDALWMGVPVLTRIGKSFPSRVCGSLLRAAGLPQLVCDTRDEFVTKAIDLGNNPQHRETLRQQLRNNRECLLFNTTLLVHSLETLYQLMWNEFLRGEIPRPDLGNMQTYNQIAIELDGVPDDADNYLERYRTKLAARQAYSFQQRDSRLCRDR